jgi:hypothetical protein
VTAALPSFTRSARMIPKAAYVPAVVSAIEVPARPPAFLARHRDHAALGLEDELRESASSQDMVATRGGRGRYASTSSR